jgi:hypothetical protein
MPKSCLRLGPHIVGPAYGTHQQDLTNGHPEGQTALHHSLLQAAEHSRDPASRSTAAAKVPKDTALQQKAPLLCEQGG